MTEQVKITVDGKELYVEYGSRLSDALDIDKPCGHFKKFRRTFHILKVFDIFDGLGILLEKFRNVYIADIEFVLLNEEKQEVERSFKCLQLIVKFFAQNSISKC
jgi:hypothetical protein